MSVEANIKLDEEMVAAINAHDVDRYMTHVADDIRTTNLAYPETRQGNELVRQFWHETFAAFSDYGIVVKDRTVTEDTIVSEIEIGGTHDGPLQLGPDQTLAATGRKISIRGVYVHTVRDGKVVEARQYPDLMGLMTQLGLMGGTG